MLEAGTTRGPNRVDVFQADPPNTAELGIFAKLFSEIPPRAGRRILSGELGYARAAMYLNGEVPERSDDGEGTNKLRGSIDCLPAHRGINVLKADQRSTASPY